MKPEQKQKAKELRNKGWSYNDIAKKLGVSKSSVSLWVRDIKLTPEQIQKLEQKNPIYNNQLCGASKRQEKAREIRLSYQDAGKLKSKENNLLHHAGCMLYWAEGTKSKNQCRFTNSDPEMIKLFIRFLRECYDVTNDKITITINCYTTNGLSMQDIENYWLSILQLDNSSIRKGQENINPRSTAHKIKHNKFVYGIICICVNSTELIQNIYGSIQEYAGFNNNYMLL